MKIIYIIVVKFILFVIPVSSFAFGIGDYYRYSGGATTLDKRVFTRSNDKSSSGRLVLDSNLAYGQLLNTRICIGVNRSAFGVRDFQNIDSYSGFDSILFEDEVIPDGLYYIWFEPYLRHLHKKTNTSRYEFNLEQGLGVVRTIFIRLWIGPGFGIYHTNLELQISNISLYSFIPHRDNGNFIKVQVNTGASIGLNCNFGKYFRIAIQRGLRHGGTLGLLKFYDNFKKSTISTNGFEWHVMAAVLFRIKDTHGRGYLNI